MIPDEAVEAAKEAFDDVNGGLYESDYAYTVTRAILESTAPILMPQTEWGIFRASDDEAGEPTENRRYRTREAAERHLRYDYTHPEFWEVRGRAVGEWRRDAV